MTNEFQRKRNYSKWAPANLYPSIGAFLNLPTKEGLTTIEYGQRKIDFLIRNRNSDTTLLMFHSALSPRQKTIPCVQGEGIAAELGMNLIALCDPSLDQGPLSCAWFLGDRETGPLKKLLKPVINKLLADLGTQHLILSGGSGGGYAAVNFAEQFPGSSAVVFNPRLNLDGRPTSALDSYLATCHNATTVTPMRRVKRDFITPDLATACSRRNFNLFILQNVNDPRFLRNQLVPFLENIDDSSNLWIKTFDGDQGHTPIPKPILHESLRAVQKFAQSHSEDQLATADFHAASDIADPSSLLP